MSLIVTFLSKHHSLPCYQFFSISNWSFVTLITYFRVVFSPFRFFLFLQSCSLCSQMHIIYRKPVKVMKQTSALNIVLILIILYEVLIFLFSQHTEFNRHFFVQTSQSFLLLVFLYFHLEFRRFDCVLSRVLFPCSVSLSFSSILSPFALNSFCVSDVFIAFISFHFYRSPSILTSPLHHRFCVHFAPAGLTIVLLASE